MIDYDDLRKKAELAKPRQGREIHKVTDYYDAMRPAVTLRLLDIIAVAKRALSIAGYSTTLAKIAKLENE